MSRPATDPENGHPEKLLEELGLYVYYVDSLDKLSGKAMRFSKKSEYALRALIELTKAYGGTPVRRYHIAAGQDIPIGYLQHILPALQHAGWLVHARGAQGEHAVVNPRAKLPLGHAVLLP